MFNWLGELNINYCPTMSLAYPAYAFNKYGIKFDESLTTTEDWDFLLRNAFICGVSDEKVVTSIYRLWVNSENSQTEHTKDEWAKNHSMIQHKLSKLPLLLPAGYTDRIVKITYPGVDYEHYDGKLTVDHVFQLPMPRRFRIMLGIRMLLPIRVYNILRKIKRRIFKK